MIKKLKRVYFEIFLVLAGYLLYTSCIQTTPIVIRSDGKGYYDYLPAVFIHKDLNFGFRSQQNTNHNVECNGYIINKYPCGLAILWTPFFSVAHMYYKLNHNAGMQGGFGRAYQFMISMAALFYLLTGLIYLRKILEHYTKKIMLIRITQVLLLFATNLFLFAYFDPAFSHVYSFSLITIFFYSWIQLSKTGHKKYIYTLAVLLALIILIRPFNVLAIVFLPFFSAGFKSFLNDVKNILVVQGKHFYLAMLAFFAIVSIQPVIWHIQCGQFFPWTYSRETFHFTQPVLVKTLLGFKKGLFIYTPILILSVLALVKFVREKNINLFLSLVLALSMLHYAISSWQTWWYGGSFGLRPYIDFYCVFAVMGTITFISVRNSLKAFALVFVTFCLFLNVFQSWQYTHGIISEETMTAKGYAAVFLKTDKRYGGWLNYKALADGLVSKKVKHIISNNKVEYTLDQGEWKSIFMRNDTLKPFGNYAMVIDLDVEADFNPSLFVSFLKDNQSVYYQELPLFFFTEGKTGRQKIHYFFQPENKTEIDGQFQCGFTKLNRQIKIHSAVFQKLEANKE